MPESGAVAGPGHSDLVGSPPSAAVPIASTAAGPTASTGPTAAGPDGASLTSLQVLRSLDSGPPGLLETQAEERLGRLGDNTLPAWRPVSWPQRFVRSLRDPFTSVLLCLGLVSAAVSAWGTASVTLVLVAVTCLLRSTEEHRGEGGAAGAGGDDHDRTAPHRSGGGAVGP